MDRNQRLVQRLIGYSVIRVLLGVHTVAHVIAMSSTSVYIYVSAFGHNKASVLHRPFSLIGAIQFAYLTVNTCCVCTVSRPTVYPLLTFPTLTKLG